VYDDFTGSLDYEGWLAEVLPRLERHGLAGRRLLDVGCGTGKSLIPMVQRGWEVVGCDISPAMLEIAQEKVGDIVRLEVADMRALPRLGDFDLVWSLNDSMNYLLAADELEAALKSMRKNLARDGLMVFDVNTILTYRTFFAERRVVEGDSQRLIWNGHADSDQAPGSICEATFEVERSGGGGKDIRHTHRQRHFSEPEVLGLVKRAELECLDVFGQDETGALHQPLDESEHVKMLCIASL
jgi:SAM-dependent methyltransferase